MKKRQNERGCSQVRLLIEMVFPSFLNSLTMLFFSTVRLPTGGFCFAHGNLSNKGEYI